MVALTLVTAGSSLQQRSCFSTSAPAIVARQTRLLAGELPPSPPAALAALFACHPAAPVGVHQVETRIEAFPGKGGCRETVLK